MNLMIQSRVPILGLPPFFLAPSWHQPALFWGFNFVFQCQIPMFFFGLQILKIVDIVEVTDSSSVPPTINPLKRIVYGGFFYVQISWHHSGTTQDQSCPLES